MTDPTTPPEPRAEPEYPHYEDRRRVEAYIRKHRTPPEPVEARDLTTAEGHVMGLMSSDNPRSRQHHEKTPDRRSMWRCIPIADAVEARAAWLATLHADTARVPLDAPTIADAADFLDRVATDTGYVGARAWAVALRAALATSPERSEDETE